MRTVNRIYELSLTNEGVSMTQTEDVREMDAEAQAPWWLQDHEHRVTKNEKDIERLRSDITDLKGDNKAFKDDIRELKEFINNGNRDQLAILNDMNAKMRDEFFKKKSTTHNEKWKIFGIVVGGIVGGGGTLTGLGYLMVKIIGG